LRHLRFLREIRNCFFLMTALALLAHAVQTKSWVEDDYADFEKGQIKNLSLRSDGRLSLGPQFKEIYDCSTPYLWALAEDSKGNLYAAGGGTGGGPGAQIYAIPRDGKGKILATLDDLEIHALAVDKKGNIYAGTSPGGKVYKVSPNGKFQVFYSPQVNYIWAMVFDGRGNLFVATGDKGEIHRVAPDGKGSVFFKTGETHARSLAMDANDNLIVGTDPGGLVLRVSPSGEGFVLYQTAKSEITAVAVAADNTIYAAGVGARQAPGAAPASLSIPLPVPSPSGGTTSPPTPSPVRTSGPTAPPSGITGGSEVYRIDPEGYPRKVWSNSQDIVYALAFDPAGRPLIATGNKGLIYRLDSDVFYTLLVDSHSTQVTALGGKRDGKVYAVTGNLGKVYQLGPGIEKEGSIESDVFDSGMFSYWGRATWEGELKGGKITLSTRSGNLDRPQNNWSGWSKADPARFVQWKAGFEASADGRSPEVSSVAIAYQAKNVRPVVERVEATPANYRFPAPGAPMPVSQNLTLPPLGRRAASSTPPGADNGSFPSMQYAKGFLGVRWAAGDENGDTLSYTVEIRGIKETVWKLLKGNVREKYLSWDSTAFPDGRYAIRVTASDAPSNPPGQALQSDLESEPFLIDNTPPAITGLSVARSGAGLSLNWHASDALSVIGKAEYSLDGGDWLVAEPTTRLSDSLELDYRILLDRVSAGEHTVAVRVTDAYDNQAVAKAVAGGK
jgi:sugar lactone lactonase YvrE